MFRIIILPGCDKYMIYIILFALISIIVSILQFFKIGVPLSLSYFWLKRKKVLSIEQKNLYYIECAIFYLSIGVYAFYVIFISIVYEDNHLEKKDTLYFIGFIVLTTISIISKVRIENKKNRLSN